MPPRRGSGYSVGVTAARARARAHGGLENRATCFVRSPVELLLVAAQGGHTVGLVALTDCEHGMAPLDVATLVKAVSSSLHASPEAVASVWGSLCQQVEARLAAGVGVALPGLGACTLPPCHVGPLSLTALHPVCAGPAFVLAPNFASRLSASRGGVADASAPVLPLNYAALAAKTAGSVPRALATGISRALLARVAAAVSGCEACSLSFGFGTLVSGGGPGLSFRFDAAFLSLLGVVPACSRRSQSSSASPPSAAAPRLTVDAESLELMEPDARRFLAAAGAADDRGVGRLSRAVVEALLRGPCSRAVEGMDALSLLRLLAAAGEFVDYVSLAISLGRLQSLRLAEGIEAHPSIAPPSPPRLASLPSSSSVPSPSSLKSKNNGTNGEATVVQGRRGLGLASAKRAEVAADAARFASEAAARESLSLAAEARRRALQLQQRAALDAQVAMRMSIIDTNS